jgi:hypothetical protein
MCPGVHVRHTNLVSIPSSLTLISSIYRVSIYSRAIQCLAHPLPLPTSVLPGSKGKLSIEEVTKHMDKSKALISKNAGHRVVQLDESIGIFKENRVPLIHSFDEMHQKYRNAATSLRFNGYETREHIKEGKKHIKSLEKANHPLLSEAKQHQADLKAVEKWTGKKGLKLAPHSHVTAPVIHEAKTSQTVTDRLKRFKKNPKLFQFDPEHRERAIISSENSLAEAKDLLAKYREP